MSEWRDDRDGENHGGDKTRKGTGWDGEWLQYCIRGVPVTSQGWGGFQQVLSQKEP